MRLLLVDDDSGFRALLRTTFEDVAVEVDEAGDAAEAERRIAEAPPDVMVLDVGLPGMDGVAFCRELKSDERTSSIRVVLLTGLEDVEDVAGAAGADALLLKPFRPLELLGVVERLAGADVGLPMRLTNGRPDEEQLVLYARDLRHLVELERGQRVLLESAYRETVSALASALGTKDTGTRQHSQRVQRYALELAATIDSQLAADPGLEYGFLLHDIGKIGVPDQILLKPSSLSPSELRVMQAHTVLGAQMIGGVAFLQGVGVDIVRSHHERWDGGGYPDGLAGTDIPLSARIFAVADALDAMTSDRPYRPSLTWADAGQEIVREAKAQFDPDVARAFVEREQRLRVIRRELAA
jgi:cyclic di-GMP phosphodiesterase